MFPAVKNGFRYRLHVKDLPGVNPIVVFTQIQICDFYTRSFWHGHEGANIISFQKHELNGGFIKIGTNITNDTNAEKTLKDSGWNVIKVWNVN